MRRALIFVALGLILLGVAGWILFPNTRADIIQRITNLWSRQDRDVTLTYWGLWEPREVIQPLLDKYQSQNPNVTIEYIMRDPEDHYRTLEARLPGEGAPDIIRVHAAWVPFLKNLLSPIPGDVMTTQEYEQTFFHPMTPIAGTNSSQSVLVKQNGTYYGIPLMIDGLALVYNQDLFLEAGVANPPRTWDEFRDAAARLTKADSQGNIVQAGAALGLAKNVDYFSDIVGLMLAQNGASFVDQTGSVTFNSSTDPLGGNLGADALEFYSIFARNEKSWSATWENSTLEFAAGKVGMVFIPSHRLHEVLNMSPEFRIGVAKVPQLQVTGSQNGNIYWANYWVESVAKASPNGRQAWEFLKWLSQPEQLTEFYRLASQLRSFGEPYPRQDMVSALSTENYVLPYVQQGEMYVSWHFTYGTFDQIHEQIISALETAVENVAQGGGYQNELNRIAGQIQSTINQNLPK